MISLSHSGKEQLIGRKHIIPQQENLLFRTSFQDSVAEQGGSGDPWTDPWSDESGSDPRSNPIELDHWNPY